MCDKAESFSMWCKAVLFLVLQRRVYIMFYR